MIALGPTPNTTRPLDGVPCPMAYGPLRDEVEAIRRRVAISVHPHLTVCQLEGDAGLDALDAALPRHLSMREGQLAQTLLLDEAGRPTMDLLVGIVRGEGLALGRGAHASVLEQVCGPHRPLHVDHTVIGVDGPFAWELLALWDSPGIAGLPYLGAFITAEGVWVLRAGTTGEFGYLLIVPDAIAQDTWASLNSHGTALETMVVGHDALAHCGHENWVFDPWRHTRAGLDALELQLTWRLDLDKEAPGMEAIRAHRARGVQRRIMALSAQDHAEPGSAVMLEGAVVGHVVASAPDLDGGSARVMACIDQPWAEVGVPDLRVHPPNGLDDESRPNTAHSVSAPWVLNRSLFVHPQRHAWSDRVSIELPERLCSTPW